jgi:hypothetical protein
MVSGGPKTAFADECLGPRGQGHSAHGRCLFAGEHRLMSQHVKADAVLRQQILHA